MHTHIYNMNTLYAIVDMKIFFHFGVCKSEYGCEGFRCCSEALFTLNAMQRAASYKERTALIILLFTNESVDADGSVPVHKMHGTGCIYEIPFPRSAVSPLAYFREQKKNYLGITNKTERERERERERDSWGFCRITRSQYITCQKPG